MRSTMQDSPLSVARILHYGATVHGTTSVTTCTSTDTQLSTFAEIAARAAAFAHALRDELGINGDQRVGTLMYTNTEHLEVLYAVSCMGAVFTPLNKQLMDDQIRHIINHAQIEVIVVDPRLLARLEAMLEQCPSVRAVVVTGVEEMEPSSSALPFYSFEALLDGRSTLFEWPELDEREAAAICYSTITEGAPKGVAYSQRSIFLQAMALRSTDSLAISHGEAFLACVPLYHVLSWGLPFAAFMTGTPLVLPDEDISIKRLAEIIASTHPRMAHGVPSLWTQLMVHYLNHPPQRMSLTEIFAGGGPLPHSVIKLWEEKYGVDVIHVWGMTETSTVATVARPPVGASGHARDTYRLSHGRFPVSIDFRVVADDKILNSTDLSHGEIHVRGPIVTAHYLDSPNTHPGGIAEFFRGQPVDNAENSFTADGWLRTGEVGSITADGYLTVADRAQDVIRSGGEWIFSAQLERLVADSPLVVEAAVIGYPDDTWGERPLAIAVLRPDIPPTAVTASLIRDSLRSSIPGWMLPEYWAFVERIDKTSVGKIDKIDLRKHLAAGRLDVIRLEQ